MDDIDKAVAKLSGTCTECKEYLPAHLENCSMHLVNLLRGLNVPHIMYLALTEGYPGVKK